VINEKNTVQPRQLSSNQEVDYGNDNWTNSTIIDSGEQSNSTSQSEVNTNTFQPTATTTSATTNVKPRLPKLTLPKFKGDVTKWNTFWDSYESTIHKNDAITKVDKFNYLSWRSLLEGTALRAIQGLNLTGTRIMMPPSKFSRTVLEGHNKSLRPIRMKYSKYKLAQERNYLL
jgi:hypothetical protein